MEEIAGTTNGKIYMKIFYNIVHSMSSAHIDANGQYLENIEKCILLI